MADDTTQFVKFNVRKTLTILSIIGLLAMPVAFAFSLPGTIKDHEEGIRSIEKRLRDQELTLGRIEANLTWIMRSIEERQKKP